MSGVAWVQWTCGCDQTASAVALLPVFCPGHAADRLAKPETLPDNPGDPIAIGHWCPRRGGVRTPCPGGAK